MGDIPIYKLTTLCFGAHMGSPPPPPIQKFLDPLYSILYYEDHEFHCDGITLGTLFFTDQLIFDLFIICLSETKFAQYFRCVSCLLGSTNWVNMLTNFRAGTRHISRDGITLR